MIINELPDRAYRQYDDARKVFVALEEARIAASQTRGGMYIKKDGAGVERLVRTSAAGSQTVLGLLDDDRRAQYEAFQARKKQNEGRVRQLEAELVQAQRRNRVERVGHADTIVIQILNALEKAGLAASFRVVGTHALYAYEARASLKLEEDMLATRDVDLMFNMDHRLHLSTSLNRLDSGLVGVLQKADRTFRVLDGQRYTLVNDQGFEVDFLRRPAKAQLLDPHPYTPSTIPDDVYIVQASLGDKLSSCEPFTEIIVAANGEMARMRTIHPVRFAELKRAAAALPNREPGKARRDLRQAQAVEQLIEMGYLETIQPPEG